MKRDPRPPGWNKALRGFPAGLRAMLDGIPDDGGWMSPALTHRVLAVSGWSVDDLMLRLLPLAACYSVSPVSRFKVGAVAAGSGRAPALYFGANLEFAGGAPGFSVHAEQSAVNHAWLAGANGVARLAVSAPPCGHCRQFLLELRRASSLRVLVAGRRKAATLAELQPDAFGPDALGSSERLMGKPDGTSKPGFGLVASAADAARRSHAPYTGALAGCTVEYGDPVRVVAGRTIESAAFNPSLPAFASAAALLVLRAGPAALGTIRRAALAERPARASQRSLTEAIVAACAPHAQITWRRLGGG